MTFADAALIAVAAFGGGMMNSIAGGGTFLTLPTLLFTGVDPIRANATSTVALLPGSLASALGYLPELKSQKLLVPLAGVSLVGSLIGAVLLLVTPASTFETLIPWLMLVATALFAGGPALTRWLRRGAATMTVHDRLTPGAVLGQFVIAVYGGYFGAGIGILMLAALALAGMEDLHAMNALKNGLATAINSIAVVTFLIAGIVLWQQAAVMIVASVAGGIAGVRLARRLPTAVTRGIITTIGVTLTGWFFWKTYGGG